MEKENWRPSIAALVHRDSAVEKVDSQSSASFVPSFGVTMSDLHQLHHMAGPYSINGLLGPTDGSAVMPHGIVTSNLHN